MQKERVTENIYIFTSDLYVRVTAGVVITTAGAVLIDTLLYPEETYQIKRYVEERLDTQVRYVINSHHHADHTTGTCFFPNVNVIAHQHCRELLDTVGRESLANMKSASHDMDDVELILPDIVFDDEMSIKIGETTFQLKSSPGHSPDSIVVLVEEEQVMFAADTVMSIPYFVGGDYHQLLASLHALKGHNYENIIQGHGEVILRGEVESKLDSDIDYLERLNLALDRALDSPIEKRDRAINAITLETCGKNHILLNGAVRQLHEQNLRTLLEQKRKKLMMKAD